MATVRCQSRGTRKLKKKKTDPRVRVQFRSGLPRGKRVVEDEEEKVEKECDKELNKPNEGSFWRGGAPKSLLEKI